MISKDEIRISASQLIFLLLNHLIPLSLVFAVGMEIGQDAWLAGLFGIGFSLAFALLYLKLADRFFGRSLIAINDIIWGPWLDKACSAFCFLFYFYVTFLDINLTTRFQKEFLPNSPSLVISLLGAGISFLMLSCGLEVIARCSQFIITFFQIPFLIMLAVLLIPELEVSNLRPLFQTPLPLLIQAALRVGAFAFGNGYTFLMIFCLTRADQVGRLYHATLKAFVIGAGYHTSIIILITLVLGPSAAYFTFPSLDLTSGEVFTRMEVLTEISIWLWNILQQTIFAYTLTTAVGELFRLKSCWTLCLPLWILLSLLSVHSFASDIDDVEFASRVYQWMIFPFQYLIPLLTLAVAVVRKLPKKKAD